MTSPAMVVTTSAPLNWKYMEGTRCPARCAMVTVTLVDGVRPTVAGSVC